MSTTVQLQVFRERLVHGDDVIERRFGHDRMAGAADIPAVKPPKKVHQLMDFTLDVRRSSVDQRALHINAAPETDLPAVLTRKLVNIHRLGLNRVQHVQADLDQVGYDSRYIAAQVHPDVSAAIAGAGPLIGPVLAAQYGYLPGAWKSAIRTV